MVIVLVAAAVTFIIAPARPVNADLQVVPEHSDLDGPEPVGALVTVDPGIKILGDQKSLTNPRKSIVGHL